MSDSGMALATFGPTELEAPSQQMREMAENRHYEVMTRINTLCDAGEAGIEAVVRARRKIQQQRDLPKETMNHLYRLECDTYDTASSIIRNIGYR